MKAAISSRSLRGRGYMKFVRLVSMLSVLVSVLAGATVAQQPNKIKRPVKNPPQYPNIIDLENKSAPPAAPQAAPAEAQPPQEPLAQAMLSLTGELKTLVQELRSLNLRQQAQLDMLRMTRVDMRIDHYERELRPVRERLSALEAEEQALYRLMTRDSLMAQSANIATVNRDQTMQQLKLNHETRLRFVQAETERLRKVEADLTASLGIYQSMGDEAERRIQAAEDQLRRIEGVRPVEGKPEQKPQDD